MIRKLARVTPCPVCMMPVHTADAEFTERRDGEVHFFCADSCRQRWLEENPRREKPKGWWGRYVDRLGKANTGAFGASGPKCH